jgi:hypothetical protein
MINPEVCLMEIFIMTNQPVSCPICGARAEIILEFGIDHLPSQLCQCPNCNYLFIEQEDIQDEH